MSKTKWQESDKIKESDMVQKLTSLRSNIEEVIAALKHQREIICFVLSSKKPPVRYCITSEFDLYFMHH